MKLGGILSLVGGKVKRKTGKLSLGEDFTLLQFSTILRCSI